MGITGHKPMQAAVLGNRLQGPHAVIRGQIKGTLRITNKDTHVFWPSYLYELFFCKLLTAI